MLARVSLGPRDEAALERIARASPAELREGVARMPSYLRTALLWLARELDLLARAPAPSPGGEGDQAPEQERPMQLAALERSRLERLIATSATSPAERAFMQQTLAHLWARVREALPCKTPR
jgi:hypothetical protein